MCKKPKYTYHILDEHLSMTGRNLVGYILTIFDSYELNNYYVSIDAKDLDDIIGGLSSEAVGSILEEINRVTVIVKDCELDRYQRCQLAVMTDLGDGTFIDLKFGPNADCVRTIPELRSRFRYR